MSAHQLHEVIDQISDITRTVWASLFDSELEAIAEVAGSLRPRRTITACVQITGPCEAATSVECSTELGMRIAARFFDVPEGDASADDVRDAMGEVANMIGGNLKGLLPGPSLLSLPTVTEGSDYVLDIRGAAVVRRFSFTTPQGVLTVSVFERADVARASRRPSRPTP